MNQTNQIRVLIADDHAVVRNGLRFFLLAYDHLEPVGEAASGEECIALCGELQPDVILMDLMMPGIGGIAAIRAIREQYPDTQLIALTSFVDDQTVQAALKAGAIQLSAKGCVGRRTGGRDSSRRAGSRYVSPGGHSSVGPLHHRGGHAGP